MSAPLISIIIPTFNYGHLLAETLESVVRQTYINWECLIIDDGSTDHTAEVVHQFITDNPGFDFQYIQLANGGTSAAKNAGIDLAKGTLIQFLDADDLLSPDKLSIQSNILTGSNAALVYSASSFFSISDGIRKTEQKYPEHFLASTDLSDYQLLTKLIQNNIVTISSPLVRTDLVRQSGKFDQTLKNNEDWILWFKIALLQPVFLYDQDERSFVDIRIHMNSAMNQSKQMFLGEVRVREEMADLLNSREQTDEILQLQRLNLDLLSLHRVRSLEISKGFSYIISNFIKNPLSNYTLLSEGCFKLLVRCYKTVIKRS
jgi:glycosyltransferase involved in cell wall biosynthesis